MFLICHSANFHNNPVLSGTYNIDRKSEIVSIHVRGEVNKAYKSAEAKKRMPIIREMFKKIDTDNSGDITLDEIVDVRWTASCVSTAELANLAHAMQHFRASWLASYSIIAVAPVISAVLVSQNHSFAFCPSFPNKYEAA